MEKRYGNCVCHNRYSSLNAKGLCPDGARERNNLVAISKGFKGKEDECNERSLETGMPIRPIKNKKAKINHRSEKGKATIKAELLLFQKIFQERDPWCEWCKAPITVFSPMNYHHLRTKGSHPELRLVESNIVKICAECHLKEHSFKPR